MHFTHERQTLLPLFPQLLLVISARSHLAMSDAGFVGKVDKYMKSLENIIQLAAKYGTKDLRSVSIYTSLANDVCNLEEEHKKVEHALEASKNEENLHSFEQRYEKELAHSKASRSKKSKRLLAFEKYAKENLEPKSASTSQSDGVIKVGDVIFDDFVSDIDPITKKQMSHPMKNKRCGHYYEKDSILEMISTNRHLRCPVVGCRNQVPITALHLVEDRDFAKKLAQRREQQEEDSD